MAFVAQTPCSTWSNSFTRTSCHRRRPPSSDSVIKPRPRRLHMQTYSNGYASSPSPSPDDGDDAGSSMNGNGNGNGSENDNESSTSYETDPGTIVDVDAVVQDVPLSELKSELYVSTSSVNRGFAVTPSLKRVISELVEQVERQNPSRSPNTTGRSLLAGRWRLVYTDALDVLSLGLLAPIALVNQVYQNVEQFDEEKGVFGVYNVVELQPFTAALVNAFSLGRTVTKIIVKAQGAVSSDTVLDLTFESVKLKPESLLGLPLDRISVPAVSIRSPVGKFETTFLDEDIRIGREWAPNKEPGSVFVFIREVESET